LELTDVGTQKTQTLVVDSVDAGYGASQVLFGASISIAEGEVVSLMGRNGMGKTTLIKSILGMIPARSGSIHFDGQLLNRMAVHRIARLGIGIVPESRMIFPSLTVQENLVATAFKRNATSTKQCWTLDTVYQAFPCLAERKASFGTQISGGEQQMLAIGRALMTNPSLLILDEATEGLAPLIRAEIWRILGTLKQAGHSILVIDKDVKALSSLADRHYFIEKGRIVWHGDSADFLKNSDLVHRYVGV
jgi:branched-chain amino acid transport system ATP-binding protein